MGWFDSVCDSIDEFSRALDRGKQWREVCRQSDECDKRAATDKRKPSSIKIGSVLRQRRSGYHHYGIYAGDLQVIHFSEGIIKETSLTVFSEEGLNKVEVMGFNDIALSSYTLEESYTRAKNKLGKKDYNLFTNNCEHFAIWCRTGIPISTQAFGSRSSSHNAALGVGTFNPTGPISAYYAKELGMEPIREVDDGDPIKDYIRLSKIVT